MERPTFDQKKWYWFVLLSENHNGAYKELIFTATNIRVTSDYNLISFTDKYGKPHVFPLSDDSGILLLKKWKEVEL